MKTLYHHLPPLEIGERKLVGHVLFGLLILLSAAVGAAGGLLLVYSTDLPQVEQLEHYRPSSVTEVYDDQSHVVRLRLSRSCSRPHLKFSQKSITETACREVGVFLDGLLESVLSEKLIASVHRFKDTVRAENYPVFEFEREFRVRMLYLGRNAEYQAGLVVFEYSSFLFPPQEQAGVSRAGVQRFLPWHI